VRRKKGALRLKQRYLVSAYLLNHSSIIVGGFVIIRGLFFVATLMATISAVFVGSGRDAMASAGCDAVNAGGFADSIDLTQRNQMQSDKTISNFAAGDRIAFSMTFTVVGDTVGWKLESGNDTVLNKQFYTNPPEWARTKSTSTCRTSSPAPTAIPRLFNRSKATQVPTGSGLRRPVNRKRRIITTQGPGCRTGSQQRRHRLILRQVQLVLVGVVIVIGL